MSIVPRDSPLNLVGKVAIVTSCSTSIGLYTTRALLNCNALVLGVSSDTVHDSTTARPGTHFHYLQADILEPGSAAKIVQTAQAYFGKNFGKDGVEVLVNVVEGGDFTRGGEALTEEVVKGMRGRGGVVLNVAVDEQGSNAQERLKKEIKRMKSQYEDKNIRCNAIVSAPPQGTDSHRDQILAYYGAQIRGDIEPKPVVTEVYQMLQGVHASPRQLGDSDERDVAQLLLYLASEMGKGVNGQVVKLEKGWNRA